MSVEGMIALSHSKAAGSPDLVAHMLTESPASPTTEAALLAQGRPMPPPENSAGAATAMKRFNFGG
jgi:hypothetical protein